MGDQAAPAVSSSYGLKRLSSEYKNNSGKPIVFDFRTVCQGLFKHPGRRHGIYHNHIHRYPGRILPQIPLFFLSLGEFANLTGYVLDPFAGTGTILLGAIANPTLRRNAIGAEINPLGRLISKVRTTRIDFAGLHETTKRLHELYVETRNVSDYVPEYRNLPLWFSSDAIKKITKLRYAIDHIDSSNELKDFLWVCFSGIIRRVAKADPYIPPPVILDVDKYKDSASKYRKLVDFLRYTERPEIWECFNDVVVKNKAKLEMLSNSMESQSNTICAQIVWDDAKNLRKARLGERGLLNKKSVEMFPSKSVDIVLTSPPYLSAQKYIRTCKLELLWLGYKAEEINELDKASIGTERVSASCDIHGLGIRSVDSLVDKTSIKSKERASIVHRYFEGMVAALKETHRVLRSNGYLIMIMGDNRVLNKKAHTYELLKDVAVTLDFGLVAILKDRIRSRSMMTTRNGTGDLIKEEYIVVLAKEK